MENPTPIGWQKCLELNMIDFCDWDNEVDQEKNLADFIHTNSELISK